MTLSADSDSPAGFCTSEFPPQPFGQAHYHIIPAPLERSVSYGSGTRQGPTAILHASEELEAIYLGRQPGLAGIHLKPTIDPDLPTAAFLDQLSESVVETVRAGSIPITLGGEHTISLGAYRGIKAHYPDEPIGIVQIDAHADLRAEYEGDPLSHACVMRRIHEQYHAPLLQLGVRGISVEEDAYRKAHHQTIFWQDAPTIWQTGLPTSILPPDFPEKIYLTFDVDGLDASLMPATGTPSPGGLFWHQIEDIFRQLRDTTHQIVGIDVVELAPIDGHHSPDFTSAVAVYAAMDLAPPGSR